MPYLAPMKYPIGIQDFRKLREGDYVYVDKTRQIQTILDGGSVFFLSRPRRFGKSLLLSTINELYSGDGSLFEGLHAEDNWNFEQRQRPVIWIKFAQLPYQEKGVTRALSDELDRLAAESGITLSGTSLKEKFSELIREMGREQRVVLLVDEYDKPIIDYLDDVPQAERNRDELKQFYSVLKDSDPYLELVFITGVSAFSKVSIFSDLNNLRDLTLHPAANELVGITQQELEHTFQSQLKSVDMSLLKRWYNGYRWGGGQATVYNPFSLLSYLDAGRFSNFWFATGTPTFLIKEMYQRKLYQVKDRVATSLDLTSFDITRIKPLTVLFQTGYLTVTEYVEEDGVYVLDYPNLEVRQAFDKLLLEAYLHYPEDNLLARILRLRNALRAGDFDTVVELLNASLADLPAHLWQGQTEHFYHAIVHLTFSLLGTYIRSEVNSARGRCDAVVETDTAVYAIEFKRDQRAGAALQQIADRGYLAPYADSPKQRFAVGVNFDSATKRIEEWTIQEY